MVGLLSAANQDDGIFKTTKYSYMMGLHGVANAQQSKLCAHPNTHPSLYTDCVSWL